VLPYAPSVLAIAAALILPPLLSLLIVAGIARRVSSKYIAAYAVGIYLWFFSDTIGDSAYLGVNSGFNGGSEQVALVLLFAFGVLLVFSLDRSAFSSGGSGEGLAFRVPVLLALAVGIHGFGEAAAFSGIAAQTPGTDMLAAFGGLSPAVAFIFHKVLESIMVGAAYWVFSRNHAKTNVALIKDILILVVAFALPGLVGAATNYYLLYDATFAFALGLGTSTYALAMLAKPLFGDSVRGWESTKTALLIVLGFLSLYFAALFHS
jgi:hypothetical protein